MDEKRKVILLIAVEHALTNGYGNEPLSPVESILIIDKLKENGLSVPLLEEELTKLLKELKKEVFE